MAFLQGFRHKTLALIPDGVLKGLDQNVKMDQRKQLHKSLQTLQLLPMLRSKNMFKADIKLRATYIFYEALVAYMDCGTRDRMGNKRDMMLMTNVCFSVLTHAESYEYGTET